MAFGDAFNNAHAIMFDLQAICNQVIPMSMMTNGLFFSGVLIPM